MNKKKLMTLLKKNNKSMYDNFRYLDKMKAKKDEEKKKRRRKIKCNIYKKRDNKKYQKDAEIKFKGCLKKSQKRYL